MFIYTHAEIHSIILLPNKTFHLLQILTNLDTMEDSTSIIDPKPEQNSSASNQPSQKLDDNNTVVIEDESVEPSIIDQQSSSPKNSQVVNDPPASISHPPQDDQSIAKKEPTNEEPQQENNNEHDEEEVRYPGQLEPEREVNSAGQQTVKSSLNGIGRSFDHEGFAEKKINHVQRSCAVTENQVEEQTGQREAIKEEEEEERKIEKTAALTDYAYEFTQDDSNLTIRAEHKTLFTQYSETVAKDELKAISGFTDNLTLEEIVKVLEDATSGKHKDLKVEMDVEGGFKVVCAYTLGSAKMERIVVWLQLNKEESTLMNTVDKMIGTISKKLGDSLSETQSTMIKAVRKLVEHVSDKEKRLKDAIEALNRLEERI